MNKSMIVLGTAVSLSSSCALPDSTYRGGIDTCIAVETLATDSAPLIDEGGYDVALTRSGLRTATADEHLAPPEEFASCAADHDVNLELVEADGRHVWLSLEATFNDEAVLPADLLSNLQNATLDIVRTDDWSRIDHVTISDDNGLITALHSGPLAGGGGINVVAEAAGPAVPATCGWATAQRLRFNDSLLLDSGSVGSLDLDDGSVSIVNIHSSSTENQHCEDGGSGVFAVWVAVRD